MSTPTSATNRPRLLGVDAALGFALAASLLADPVLDTPWKVSWPSATVFFVVGVMVSLATGGTTPPPAGERRALRMAVLRHAVLLFALGLLVEALSTGLSDLLVPLAVVLVLLMPMLFWTAGQLLITAGLLAVLVPIATQLVRDFVVPDYPYEVIAVGGWVAGTPYPAVMLIAVTLVGAAVGRFDLTDSATQRRVAVIGTVLGLAGWVLSRILDALSVHLGGYFFITAQSDTRPSVLDWAGWSSWREVFLPSPFAFTPVEALTDIGIATAIVGFALLAVRRWQPDDSRSVGGVVGGPAFPLVAYGRFALTMYPLSVLATRLVLGTGDGVRRYIGPTPDTADPLPLAAFIVIVAAGIAIASAGALFMRRGPIETAIDFLAGLAICPTRRTDEPMTVHRPRLLAVDLALGVALAGTLITDPRVESGLFVSWPSGMLFVLVGVALALASSGPDRLALADRPGFRLAVLVRAICLLAVGIVLDALDTGLSPILPSIAVVLVLVLPAVFTATRKLVVLSVVWMFLGAAAAVWLQNSNPYLDRPLLGSDLLAADPYAAIQLASLTVAGLALGRLDLRSRVVQLRVAASGAIGTAVGILAGAVLTDPDTELLRHGHRLGTDSPWRLSDGAVRYTDYQPLDSFEVDNARAEALATGTPYSGSPIESFTNISVAALILGLALLALRRWQDRPTREPGRRGTLLRGLTPFAPLIAYGQFALSAYAGTLIVVWVVAGPKDRILPFGAYSSQIMAMAALVGIVVCTAARAFAARGPLEAATDRLVRRATGETPELPTS